jgi:aspartyl-tRNA(Asn)/glutamyl-tRNA(Gln) amidotransferase subunit A
MNTDPAMLSAAELRQLYRTRKLSPVETTRAVLERIERFDPAVNGFCLVDEERAIAAARASEARWHKREPCGVLDGVPATIKDLVLTRDWPTLRGSLVVARDQPWEEDAPATARLREQGAVLIGKTTTPEFGWKAVTDCALTGVTRNPWDTGRTPGGSSGGAAVAAALGMGVLHVGTDGGGSIRIPAGFTGVFGLKPSFGRVPAYPASPFGTVAHIGPITRTVSDAALMLNALALPDSRDWFGLPYDGRDYRVGLEDGVRGLRIAFSPTLGFVDVDAEIADLVACAAGAFVELGATVEQVDVIMDDPINVFVPHWYVGAANLLRGFTAEQRAKMDEGLQEIAAAGAQIALMDYLTAMRRRAELGAAMRRFHGTYDLLLTPTLPLAAFEAGKERPDPAHQPRWINWAPFSNPFNLTQQPAASVPCGLTAAGLPVGLQIVGPMHADALVLRAARAFEAARPWPLPEAPRRAAG